MVKQLPRTSRKNPGLNLNQARGILVMRNDTFTHWCRRNGYSVAYAHQCVRGLKHGPKAHMITKQLAQEVGL